MYCAPALPVVLGLALAGCTGDRGPTGSSANAEDVATALATNPAIEAAIAARVEREVEDFIVENRDGLTGDDGQQGEQGPQGEPGPQGEMGTQGETGPKGEDATRWKVCGVSQPVEADRAGDIRCRSDELCTDARMCTVDELLAGALSTLTNSTVQGSLQTNYLREVGQRLIADGLIDSENPYAFVHSGYWSTSCENYSEDAANTKEAFSDEFVPMSATTWPLIQLAVGQVGESDSSRNAVSARRAPCNITAPVICCDADGRPSVNPPQ